MKILLAADGSKFTKKALAFLMANDSFCSDTDELLVLHVQAPISPRVKTMLGAGVVRDYHVDEAQKVLAPIEKFLARHAVKFKTKWVVGSPADEVLAAVKREKSQMVVMGTHGHGVVSRALLGSVAQRVVTGADVPVLLVK